MKNKLIAKPWNIRRTQDLDGKDVLAFNITINKKITPCRYRTTDPHTAYNRIINAPKIQIYGTPCTLIYTDSEDIRHEIEYYHVSSYKTIGAKNTNTLPDVF